VAGLSAGIAALAIVIAWVDEMVVPPSQQLVGTVAGAPLESVQIDLLDYRGQPLGARVGKDLASALFAINYVPEFADPPSAVFLKAPGCEEQRFTLRRPHLKGQVRLAVQLVCGGSN
jgi:hypothetical protein